jgi:hypothetical protein
LLSSGPQQLAETSRAVFNVSEGIAEYNKVALEEYIKSVDVALAVELLVSLTCDLLAILKVEYSKPISPFKISVTNSVY